MPLIPYPDDFLDAAKIIVARLRDDPAVSPMKAVHAAWHLAGVALGHISPDIAAKKELFRMTAPPPHPTGLLRTVKAPATMADELEALLVGGMEPDAKGLGWLDVLKLLIGILFLFLGANPNQTLDWMA